LCTDGIPIDMALNPLHWHCGQNENQGAKHRKMKLAGIDRNYKDEINTYEGRL